MKTTFAKELEQAIAKLPTYVIEIGVFSGDEANKRTIYINGKKTSKQDNNVDNAEILFIAENGSKARHIPKRPVLSMTIDWAKKEGLVASTYKKALSAYIDSGYQISAYELEIEKMCIKMEKYARDIIRNNDNRLARNSARTIAMKGYDHPLFQTGQLYKSIRCRFVRR